MSPKSIGSVRKMSAVLGLTTPSFPKSLSLFVALGGSQGSAELLEDRESLIRLVVNRNYGGEVDSLSSVEFGQWSDPSSVSPTCVL
jgi:hypothetical protein